MHGLGNLTSFMAKYRYTDLSEALTAFAEKAFKHHSTRRESSFSLGTYLARKISEKVRKFNVRPASTLKDKSPDAYRKAKEGE